MERSPNRRLPTQQFQQFITAVNGLLHNEPWFGRAQTGMVEAIVPGLVRVGPVVKPRGKDFPYLTQALNVQVITNNGDHGYEQITGIIVGRGVDVALFRLRGG